MSLENIFNWIWTTNILWVMGAVVLVGIGLVILFYTFDSIIDFIFSYWWILLLVPLGYWVITIEEEKPTNLISNERSQEQLDNNNKELMSFPEKYPNNPLFTNQKELQYFKDDLSGDVIPYNEYQRRKRERAIQEGRLKPANK